MSKNITNEQESLIEFPCNFIIKVTGVMKDNFTQSIIEEINKVDKTFNASKIEIRPSQKGNYIGLTCNVLVNSKSDLDQIYQHLSSHPDTRFVI